MKSIFIVLAAFIVIAVLAGCKKNGEDESSNRRQLLTDDVWILTGTTFTKVGSTTPEDIFTPMNACAKDDEFHYLPDQKFYHTNGDEPCPGEPEILLSGNWEFSADEKSIFLTINSVVGIYEILEVTRNSLSLKIKEAGGEYVYKYKH